MLLPNAEKAVVEISKHRDYCLNPNHEVGKHKARVFAAALNLGFLDVEILQAALIDAVKNNDAVSETLNTYGLRYRVDFELDHIGKIANIRSVWIIDTGMEIPRLITCFVL